MLSSYGPFNAPVGSAWSKGFDDPFIMPSTETIPKDQPTVLDLCLYLYLKNPQLRQAGSRTVRHFITDFDYPGEESQEEKNALDKMLHYELQLPLFMTEFGDEWNCYGNAFCRMHMPFDRFLYDPRNGAQYALEMFPARSVKYSPRNIMYNVPDPMDPKGRSRISMKFRDLKSSDITRMRLMKLDPHYITIQHNMRSGSSRYIQRFEPEFLADVTKGHLWTVNETPIAMLEAVARKQDFLYADDAIFHMKSPTVSGISTQGWGLPPILANYENIHQLQVYRKIDEAIAMDYMLPFRLFSPQTGVGINDQTNAVLMQRWQHEIGKVIRARRSNKFAMHSLPFPVEYQEFGGQGKTLTPKDLMALQVEATLDGFGYPQELFKGSLQFVQVPTAMRLFEISFLFLHIGFNNLTQWVVRKMRLHLNQPAMAVVMQRPSLAMNLERKQLLFQLASMGEISRETAYEMLGIDDAMAERRKRLEEDVQGQRDQARMQAELQREVESGAIGAPVDQQPGDGTRPGGSGQSGPAVSPLDKASDAQELAQYWLNLPEGERTKAMQAVKAQDEGMYSLAKEKMEQVRRQGASQGRAMAGQGGMQQ